MSDLNANPAVSEQTKAFDKTMLGFWVYIMTDCVLFASLFAAFVVLRHNLWGGEGAHEIFSLPYVLLQTVILLTSSFTMGVVLIAARTRQQKLALGWLVITFLFGFAFLSLELIEFAKLINEGNSWRESAFLSSYFALVGTHGLHITAGLIWIATLAYRLYKSGLKDHTIKQLNLLALFWHFLDVIWIFIFSIVYLMGAL